MLGLIFICFVFLFVRFNFLDISLDRNEGLYLTMATSLLDGNAPYLDFYSQHPPGLVFSYALLVLIFGKTAAGIHIGFSLINIANLVLLFFITKKWMNTLAGLVAAGSLGILSLSAKALGFAAIPEFIVVLLILSGLYLLLKAEENNKRNYFICTGVLCALAILVKWNSIVFYLCFVIWLILLGLRHSAERKQSFRRVGFLSFGSLLVFILFGLILLLYGSLSTMFFWNFEYPEALHTSQISYKAGMKYFQHYFKAISTNSIYLWYIALAGLIGWLINGMKWKYKALGLLFFIASIVTLSRGLFFYGQYWQMIFPVVAISVASCFYLLNNRLNNLAKSVWIGRVLFLSFMAIMALIVIKNKGYYFDPKTEEIVKEVYKGNSYVEIMKLSAFLKDQASKGDELLVLGSEPQFNFYSGLQNPSRHLFSGHLDLPISEATEWKRELRSSLAKNPKFVALSVSPFSWQLKTPEGQNYFNSLYYYLSDNYKQIGVADIGIDGRATYALELTALKYTPRRAHYVIVYQRK